MVIDEVMWDIFDDVNFFFDEEYEATVVQCSHPIIDRLYEQGRASDPKHGSRQSVWSKKLHDITEYFVLGATNSVYKFSQHIAGDHVILEFCLSPDYYEPLYFANSLVDLLRYCQCSIRRIEAKLAERETENIWMKEICGSRNSSDMTLSGISSRLTIWRRLRVSNSSRTAEWTSSSAASPMSRNLWKSVCGEKWRKEWRRSK